MRRERFSEEGPGSGQFQHSWGVQFAPLGLQMTCGPYQGGGGYHADSCRSAREELPPNSLNILDFMMLTCPKWLRANPPFTDARRRSDKPDYVERRLSRSPPVQIKPKLTSPDTPSSE